jgi:hypothetical protein
MSQPGPVKRWFITWVWNHTPTCKEITRLASQRLDGPLPLTTRLRLRLHTLICVWCQRYLEQVKLVHDTAPSYAEQVEKASDKSLSTDAKERMKRAMRDRDAQ